jgi:hypothetical protein
MLEHTKVIAIETPLTYYPLFETEKEIPAPERNHG